AYVYYGGASMNNGADVIMTGEAAQDQFGYSVSNAGDVNGDGYSDVIVGANLNDAGGTNCGRAYIYFGGSTMNNVSDVVLTGETAYDFFGQSVSTAGDVNNDGYSDVIVGAPYSDSVAADAGRAYIYFGGTNMNNSKDLTMTGEGYDDSFGASVSFAGDLNGDGFSDVIIGANSYYGNKLGKAYIYFGGINMNNVYNIRITSATLRSNFGSSLSFAGDVNSDRYDDVIIGAYYNEGTSVGP
ncbi:MAG: FG-GAP repeat protein, partial [Ignavibacteriae bacterium]|nr:FG-GAP repeat protein [Ignavibacteriota bacterium]